MNRNVTILIIILIILLIAGYLLWLRSRFQKTGGELTIAPTPTISISQVPQPTSGAVAASPSALPAGRQATATPSSKVSPTAKPTKTSTSSGSRVK